MNADWIVNRSLKALRSLLEDVIDVANSWPGGIYREKGECQERVWTEKVKKAVSLIADMWSFMDVGMIFFMDAS